MLCNDWFSLSIQVSTYLCIEFNSKGKWPDTDLGKINNYTYLNQIYLGICITAKENVPKDKPLENVANSKRTNSHNDRKYNIRRTYIFTFAGNVPYSSITIDLKQYLPSNA